MTSKLFEPTYEQQKVIEHEGSAFISACPGAGKTRVMIERARRLLGSRQTRHGIAFLSFTIAAVSELEDRLRREGLVETPVFPNFIGTFDAFIWQFLVEPFGIDGCGAKPKLIPDKGDCMIRPFQSAQALPLECFDRTTGNAIRSMIQRHGFRGSTVAHETAARNARARFLDRGELDFVDARTVALARLRDPTCGSVLAGAFAARFLELIVDEAQDCNPADLEIIGWFREAGVPVMVICDPNQAIYGFRGGVTQELIDFADTFDTDEKLHMSGNFRSSKHIAKGIVGLRAPQMRAVIDEAIGEHRTEPTAVQILSYSGSSVPSTIGAKFRELVTAMGLEPRDCPVVSATRRASASALGHPQDSGVRDLSYRLAVAVSDFHFSYEIGARKDAPVAMHRILLELRGTLGGNTYHQCLANNDIRPDVWRPEALNFLQKLRFDLDRFATSENWLDEARRLLAPLLPANGPSISQRLRRNGSLNKALSVAPPTDHPARTIHSVKGKEFPAVCVVMTTSTAKNIIDFLSEGLAGGNEEARKIYVGASRAQRLLAIALPRTQAPRLRDLMIGMGGDVQLVSL